MRQKKQRKKQKKAREDIQKELDCRIRAWRPLFAADGKEAESRELQELLKEAHRSLSFICFIEDGDRVLPLYEEVRLQLTLIEAYSGMYTGYERTRDAVLKIGAAIRALITITNQ